MNTTVQKMKMGRKTLIGINMMMTKHTLYYVLNIRIVIKREHKFFIVMVGELIVFCY